MAVLIALDPSPGADAASTFAASSGDWVRASGLNITRKIKEKKSARTRHIPDSVRYSGSETSRHLDRNAHSIGQLCRLEGGLPFGGAADRPLRHHHQIAGF